MPRNAQGQGPEKLGSRLRTLSALAFCVALFAAPAAGAAQVPTRADSVAVDSLRAEVAGLQATVDSLIAVLQGIERPVEDAQDAVERLRAAAQAAIRAAEAEQEEEPENQEFVGGQRSLQALNPEISVTADVFGLLAEGEAGEDNFVARGFEFAFQSALDPYSRAKIIVGHHRHGGELEPFGSPDEPGEHGHEAGEQEHGSGETEIEEGYVEWTGLPGGLGITLGRFRQRLGTYNRWHQHALPGQSYFLPYRVLFGEEGLAQAGLSLHWLAPFEGAGAYEGWLEVTRSDNPFFGASRRLSYLAHVNAFWQASPSTYLELGVSGLTGTLEDDTGATSRNRLLHVEAGFNWRPPERALYREVNLRGAILVNDRAPGEDGSAASGETAIGGFGLAEVRLGRQWWLGARVDYAENPTEPSQSAWLLAPTLSWWQSEWVRIRAEYDVLDDVDGRRGLFLIQTTISMGPHKHETY